MGRRGFIGSLVAAAVACVVPLTKKRPVIEAHVDQGDGKITVIELEAINRRLIDDIIYQLRRQQRRDEVAVPLGRPDEAGAARDPERMNRINDWLWIADANDGRDHEMLEREGITHVFNATHETDGWPADFKARTPYLRLDQADGAPIPPEKLDQFAAWLAVQSWKPSDANPQLLVHCGAGISRASTFAALTLMVVDGVTWTAAIERIRKVRPMITPNPILIDSLRTWWAARGGRAEALA